MFQTPELNLQTELYELLFTDKDCSPIKRPFVHKRLRRDSQNKPILCSCVTHNGFSEGVLSCPYCYGDGVLSDEVLIEGYSFKDNYLRERFNYSMPQQVGYNNNDPLTLITDSNVVIHDKDRIYTLELDAASKIKIPLLIEHKYTVYYTNKLKASNNNLEFNLSILWD